MTTPVARIKSAKDCYSGLLFMAVAIGFAWGAAHYKIGDAARMGPGYFSMMLGILPGPQVMTRNPQLFWSLVALTWIGNARLVILNLPLIGLWIKLLTVPYRWQYPAIVLLPAVRKKREEAFVE